MMNADQSDSDIEVSFSDLDSKLENESLRRTSRIRYCSRKMLEAQALLKDKVKITKSEFNHTHKDIEVSSLISRRRSLDAINMNNEFDGMKHLNVTIVNEKTISGSNSIEHLVRSETNVESKPFKSNVKRSSSLDSDTSKIKITNFNSDNKMETEINSFSEKNKDNEEGYIENKVNSSQMLDKKVQKSLKRKMERDQINIQKSRKTVKPNNSIEIIKLSKTLRSDDGDNKSKKALIKDNKSTKARNKKELSCKSNKESKEISYSPELAFIEKLCNDQSSKDDSCVIAVDFKVGKNLQNDQDASRNTVENFESDGKGKKEKLRSLRMINDCNVVEDELLDHIAIDMNNNINNILETNKKRPKNKSKVSVSQVGLDKIKLMNVKKNVKREMNGQFKANKKVAKPSVKVSSIYKKSVKGKKIGASRILKKKIRNHLNVTASNKKTKLKSVIASTQNVGSQNVIENHNKEDSRKSLIITEFSSLLSKYGAIKLSATKKKLGIVPNSFLNLELVLAAINCQYFGFQEVFDWISKCLKLKNVCLTQMVENQFKLFEQFFIHMSKSIMTDEDEDEWSKLRVKYYNLPVNSQTSWELVFGYTPKLCNNINFDSSLTIITSDIKEEANKETFDISLNGFKMEVTEKKSRPNRKTKTDNSVISKGLNTKECLKTKISGTRKLTDDKVVSAELNTKDNSKTKIPMVKIYGYIPEVSTKKSISKSNIIDMKLQNDCSSKIINNSDMTSCNKNIDNKSKPALEKLCSKDQSKKIKGKKIQLKDTLWNSKKKYIEKISNKCVIETDELSKIVTEENAQKEKRELIKTSENLETKAEVNLQNNLNFEPHEIAIASNKKDDCKSFEQLGCKVSKNIGLHPRRILKENCLEKSSKKRNIRNKVEKFKQTHQLPLLREVVEINDSNYSNITEVGVSKKDICENIKLDEELPKENIKEIECKNTNNESNKKILQPKPIYLRKLHKEKCVENSSKKESIDNKEGKLPKTHQLHIPMEIPKTDKPHFSDRKEIDLPKEDKWKNGKIDKESSKEKRKEIECNYVNNEFKGEKIQTAAIYLKRINKDNFFEKKSKNGSIDKETFETDDSHASDIKEIDIPKKDKCKNGKLDKESYKEKIKEIECNYVNSEIKGEKIQTAAIYLKRINKDNFLEKNSKNGSIDKETFETDDSHASDIKVSDLPKKKKCKKGRLDKNLSRENTNEIEFKNVNIVSNDNLLPTVIHSTKTRKKKCLEEKSEKETFDNGDEKLPQIHELAFYKEIARTLNSDFSSIKEVDLPIKDNCINRKLDKELSKEKNKDVPCNYVNVESNKKNTIILKENTFNDGSSIKKDVKLISTNYRSSENQQSFNQGHAIPRLVNYFKRSDSTNLDSVFETLKLIKVIVANVFCEKNILNLSKGFVQKNKNEDNHGDLDLAIPLEARERHFTRSVSIIKADEMVTSKNISATIMPTSVSSVDLNKNASTIDPKVSVISQVHESLQITISGISSDLASPQKNSEIISHKSPHKKISKSCTCCKSLCDIKSQLEELFCNNLENKRGLDVEQTRNVQRNSHMEEIEINYETRKDISIDDCMHQNAFLKQNLDHLNKTHKNDMEKLAESYVCELEKREENHKEHKNKCVEDSNKLQEQMKVLVKLNEFILIENKSELEKQSKRLMEEHNLELEKQRVEHSAQLKKIEECKVRENFICELETQKENLKEQKIKLEEEIIRLQKQVIDLEKVNESILIDKKKEIENQYRKLTEEHNKDLDKQRERHITQLKKLEEHKKHLKGQLLEKNRIISKRIQNKKDHALGIASAANNSLKRTNFEENQRVTKLLKSESDIASVDTHKGKILLQEKLEKLTSYRPESSCDIVAKIAKHSDNRLNVNSQISSLSEEQNNNNNNGNLFSLASIQMNYNSFNIFPSTTLTPQKSKFTKEVVDLTLSPSKEVFSNSSEKKKIKVEEYRLRNCKKLSNEDYDKCSTFTRHDSSIDPDYSETKTSEESIQEYDNENTCKKCEGFKKESEGYKKELEELTCELQEFKNNKSETDNNVNTLKADMYHRYHMMKSSLEDTNNSMKSNIENLMKSNQQLKTENENLIKNYEELNYEKKDKVKLYDNFKEISEKKNIECEIAKENLRKQFEQSQYENKLLKKEMEKLHIDLGNSKFKCSAEQTKFKKEIDLKENYINQLHKENVKKDEILIDKEIVIQRLSLIEKRYVESIKDKQLRTENLDSVCKTFDNLGEIEKKITKKDDYADETKATNKEFMNELNVSSTEEDTLNGNDNVRKRFKQLEKNSATIHDKMKKMSSQLIQNQKENEKMEATTKELKILLFEEQSKVKLLETKQKNLEKQQLGCTKNHSEDVDKKKIKGLQLFESLEINRKVSLKIKGSIRTRLINKSKIQLKIKEQKQEIIKLSNAFEKEKEAAEYYGKHLYYQRSRNALLEERLSGVYRDNLRELSMQLSQFDGAAERYRSIMNNLADLNKNQDRSADFTKNHEHSDEFVIKDQCIELSGPNILPAIAVLEKKPVNEDKD